MQITRGLQLSPCAQGGRRNVHWTQSSIHETQQTLRHSCDLTLIGHISVLVLLGCELCPAVPRCVSYKHTLSCCTLIRSHHDKVSTNRGSWYFNESDLEKVTHETDKVHK